MEQSIKTQSRTRSIAFCGLSVALMATSAWITVPAGPVPFTLQTFVMVFVLLVLQPKEALASIAIYILMGAVGLPVFSSMRGGIGVLAGPTGGFIWGFFAGAVAALVLVHIVGMVQAKTHPKKIQATPELAAKMRPLAVDVAAAAVFMGVCYLCGWLQLAFVAGMGLEAAFATGVAPFIIIDAAKLVVAVVVARAVRTAVR